MQRLQVEKKIARGTTEIIGVSMTKSVTMLFHCLFLLSDITLAETGKTCTYMSPISPVFHTEATVIIWDYKEGYIY